MLARWADAHWDIGRDFGTIGARRGDHHRRGHDLPRRRLRRADPQAGGGLRGQPRGRPGAPRLHRQRDGAAAARRWSSSTRTAGWPTSPRGCCARPGRPRCRFGDDPLRMMRAARFAAQLGVRRGARGARRRCARWPTTRDRLGRAGPRRAGQAAAVAATPRRGLLAARRDRPGRPRAARAAGAAAGGRRAPPPQGRLRALADGARAGHRARGTGRRAAGVGARPRPRAAPGRAAARHRQAGDPPVRGRRRRVASTTTRWSAPSWPPSGCKALRFDKDTIKAVARLVELHLRFHGYGEGQWTDSAVRRYVTDAGPLLPRLHRLTRSDSHHPQPAQGRAARRAPTTTLEARIERAARAGGAGQGAARARRQRDRRGPRHQAGPRARPGLQAPARGAARRGADRQGRGAGAAARSGGRSSPSRRPSPRPSPRPRPPARPTCRPRLADPVRFQHFAGVSPV